MAMEWRLGKDLSKEDNLLDGITFGELITTVHCNCRIITPEVIRKEADNILSIRMQDMRYILENNLDVIAEEAMKGRK